MPLPDGITYVTVTISPPTSWFGAEAVLDLTVTPTHSLIHVESGTPLVAFAESFHSADGAPLSIDCPHTDQPGFIDSKGQAFTGWAYTFRGQWSYQGQTVPFVKHVQIPSTTTGDVDLDIMPPGRINVPVSAQIPVVFSLEGLTGPLTLEDIGLDQVDNTPDVDKPISILTAAAIATIAAQGTNNADELALRAPIHNPSFTGTVTGVSKAMVGLSSVNDTADTAKPVSTLQQAALNLKADQTALANKLDTTARGAASGVAGLDAGSKLLETNIPTRLSVSDLSATFVPKWKATTAYLAGDKVLSPAGDVVSAKVNFTSGATFSVANWDYSSTFTKSDAIPGIVATEVTTQLAADGTVRDAAVDAVEAYVAAGGIAASGPGVVWEGDSLSAQGGGTSTNPAGYLAAYTLQTVRTDAVGGETAEGIAARTNAMPFLMLPVGGSIPASGGVTVTFTTPSGQTAYPLLQTNGNPTLGQTFVGAIKLPAGVYVRGTLTLTQPSGTSTSHQADDYYTFTRTTAGSSIAVARPAAFYVDFAEAHRGDIHVLQYGRNNMVTSGEDVPTAVNRVLAAVAAKVAYLRAAQKRFIIVGVHNGTGEASGTLTYQKVVALNAALKALYGRLFVDYRTYLIAYGLADAAITPTGSDTTAIAEDRVPPSLLTDGLHLQLVTRQIIAKLVGDREYELGWISLIDVIAPTAPTSLASSVIGATSFTLSWTASTDNLSVAAYDVYLDGVLKTTVTATNATLTGLTGATAYVAMVKARDDAGNVSAASSTLSVTTQTLVADTFDRADSATVGGIWNSNALYKIASNKLTRAAASGTISILSCATAMSTPNHKASVVINRGTATTSGLVVRRIDDNNFYAARINLATNNVLLYKVVAGVTTSLSGLDSQWLSEGSTLTLEVIGTSLKAYVNGTQVLSTAANEATLVSGTGVGIRADAAGATLPTFDNFTAEAYA